MPFNNAHDVLLGSPAPPQGGTNRWRQQMDAYSRLVLGEWMAAEIGRSSLVTFMPPARPRLVYGCYANHPKGAERQALPSLVGWWTQPVQLELFDELKSGQEFWSSFWNTPLVIHNPRITNNPGA